MTKEDYVFQQIKDSGHTVKSFSAYIGLPYTTLLSMLKRGLSGASVHNVIRVCKGLNITVEELRMVELRDDADELAAPFFTTETERTLIRKYREKPDLRLAVHILLGLSESQ